MDLHLELGDGKPRQRHLQAQLRDAIRSGRLPFAARLPPTRVLAEQLGVSRSLIVECYAQLTAEGYLSSRVGSGTLVAYRSAPSAAPASIAPVSVEGEPLPRVRFDLRPGQPDLHAFPRHAWSVALARALAELPDLRLTYENPQGAIELREAVADYVQRVRAVVAGRDNVVVCCGVTHALTSIWHALRRQGAVRVGVEDPGWRWVEETAERAGLEVVPVPVDDEGIVVYALDEHELDALAVTPAHQFPTGVVLSAARRNQLIEWARRGHKIIVEDDYDAEYRYDRKPVATLQGMAPDVVVYAATMSKTLAPAVRIGWTVAPSHLVELLTKCHDDIGAQPPVLEQLAVARFMEEGSLDRHLRKMRRRYRAKHDLLVDLLTRHVPQVEVRGIAGGLHLLAVLPDGTDDLRLARAVRREGLAVHTLRRHCAMHRTFPPALLLGYALPTEAELTAGVRVLAGVLARAAIARPDGT